MSEYAENLSSAFAQRRYENIAYIVDSTVKKDGAEIFTLTDMLDQVFLNKYLSIPIFLTILWTMFQFAFAVSEPFVVILEKGFDVLKAASDQVISNPYLASFVSSAIFDGVGSVLVFVPPIFFLYLALSVLEDSGYMARGAFVIDRIMYHLGLHGRSFIPLMIGFGCNVPAVMAARSMDNEKDRMITMLVTPLISCSARLPVFVMMAGALFSATYAGTVVFALYVLGIVLVIIMALVFRRTLFKGEASPFVLELPTYAVPDATSTVLHTWSRGKMFLRKAGTVIFGGVILVWFLSVNPWDATSGGQLMGQSYMAWLGHAIEPVFSPFGWNWMGCVALLAGFIAKEVVVGTYGILLGTGVANLGDALVSQGLFTPLTGFAFMAFVLVYTPCVATLGIFAKETNSLRWPAFALIYGLILGFIVAGVITMAGRMMGFS